MLKDERERASWRVVARKLVVVEIRKFRVVRMAHVDDGDRRISKIGIGWFASFNGDGMFGEQEGAREQVVFMGTAWMSDYGLYVHLW